MDLVADFQRDGFVTSSKPLLDEHNVDELSHELNRIVDIGPRGFKGRQAFNRPVLFRNLRTAYSSKATETTDVNWQIVNIWEASSAFERLLYHPEIVSHVSRLTGAAELRVWHDQIQYKPAGVGGAQNWHQDAPLWPIIRPMTAITAWIPIDDCDEENGCMFMVPGSHRWGDKMSVLNGRDIRRRESLADFKEFPAVRGQRAVPRPVKKRFVHFHHSLTWHGSPSNPSGRHRRAIAIHYMTGDAWFRAEGDHPMKSFVSKDLVSGAPMSGAGEHFPLVCSGGVPVAAPAARARRGAVAGGGRL